ncbi:beta-propeller domain-containing protein [Chryseomicrobium sp. FSL W7-1435]|uniref:beta-propeller domain-containing protein n=1 Tax=Chryseomicrobium sp. FSL W7-1435 TaxID=2921704 RepID=UPI003159971F
MTKWKMPMLATLLVGLLIGGFYFSGFMKGETVKAYPEMTVVNEEVQLRDYFERVRKSQKNNYGLLATEGSEAEESASSDSAGSESGTKSADVSTTNNQVEGVDEADSVKLNEDYIYLVSEQDVVIFDIRNPDQMEEAGKITFGNSRYPSQLFLTEDYLVVLNQNYMYDGGPLQKTAEGKKWAPYDGMTLASIYTLEDPTNPKLVREVGAEGHLGHARMTNNTIYFTSSLYSRMWALEEDDDVELRPFTYDSEASEDPEVMDYENITILPDTLEGGYTLISAISLNDLSENQLSTEGYLGSGEQFYMSLESLYLTTTVYTAEDEEESSEDSSADMDTRMWNPGVRDTDIYKFDFEGTTVEFIASHRVEGHLLNQFSMDEYDNHFRVVTTEGDAWDESQPSENHLFILDEQMKRVGEIKGLAKTERIYSARFMGDKAYMVTFKETDPLFVFDLSDPTAPAVLGELKIPGFSNYLHPIGENHLLGVGYDTEMIKFPGSKEPSLVTGGMKLSLFDVSDFSNPKEQDVEIIGGQGTYSPVQYDHKAMMIHAGKGYYGFPVTIYDGKPGESMNFEGDGAHVYSVTPEEGIQLKAALMNERVEGQQYEEWNHSIQRLVYVDNTLYTLANQRIQSYDFTTFTKKSTLDY